MTQLVNTTLGKYTGWSVLFSRKLPPYETIDVEVRSEPGKFQLGNSYRDLKVDEGYKLVPGFFPEIRGTGTNTGDKPAEFVQVHVIAYDAEDNVLFVGLSYIDDDVLAPGATSRFAVSILVTEEEGTPASYDLFVEGTEANQ